MFNAAVARRGTRPRRAQASSGVRVLHLSKHDGMTGGKIENRAAYNGEHKNANAISERRVEAAGIFPGEATPCQGWPQFRKRVPAAAPGMFSNIEHFRFRWLWPSFCGGLAPQKSRPEPTARMRSPTAQNTPSFERARLRRVMRHHRRLSGVCLLFLRPHCLNFRGRDVFARVAEGAVDIRQGAGDVAIAQR